MKIRVLKQAFLASVAMAFAATSSLAATATDPVLAEVTTGEWRSADEKSRDAARKPIENLQFWGLKPGADSGEPMTSGVILRLANIEHQRALVLQTDQILRRDGREGVAPDADLVNEHQ